jgi:hypothetical protein
VSEPVLPSRRRAIALLVRQRAETREFLAAIPRRRMSTPGLGGGDWSPKDLIGHLASWETFALEALAAWERGERAPIDDLQFSVSTARINAGNVERKAPWSLARVEREGARTHAQLLDAIGSLSDTRWRAPATPRGRRPLGARIGGILGGPRGPFRHDEAHHGSLRGFVEETRGRGRA